MGLVFITKCRLTKLDLKYLSSGQKSLMESRLSSLQVQEEIRIRAKKREVNRRKFLRKHKKIITRGAAGVAVQFILNFVVSCYYYYMETHIIYAIGLAFLISLATAITEAKSSKGYDNFFIPAITLIIMYIIDVL